ncbi:MAG: DUF4922 domain-containing protein [Bacteroidales bacterium]
MSLQEQIEQMFSRELSAHGRAFVNNQALSGVRKKEMPVDGFPAELHFNPARVASVMAKVDEQTLRTRQCFLCSKGLSPEQLTTVWKSDSGTEYWIRVNPFPIFNHHFTVSLSYHKRQQIEGHFADMLSLARALPAYLTFYNGPMCGASAPDHMHFQAIPKGCLPVENMVRSGENLRMVKESEQGSIGKITKYVEGGFVIRSTSAAGATSLFDTLYALGTIQTAKEWEPRMNILSWWENNIFTTVVYFRAESRPECFWAENPNDRILISPASVEMSGVAIVSSAESFNHLTAQRLGEIIREVSLTKHQSFLMEQKLKRPQETLSVGIFSQKEVNFVFNSPFVFEGKTFQGGYRAAVQGGKVLFEGKQYDTVIFSNDSENGSFELKDVTIGVNFHWERKENQVFAGNLKLIVENDKVTAINLIGIEDYLLSVISSEMSATASKQLLKAHAVISRSWILAQIQKNKEIAQSKTQYSATVDTEDELIKWYDREDHVNFDVCADDHCQRYQGLTRASTQAVREVIDETWGEVLTYDGKICDARFSKCCGGVFEEFQYCWENIKYPYLAKVRDSKTNTEVPDLTIEENARKWILSSPEAFCNTSDKKILSQVLNNYDQETVNFYRWKQEYGQKELSELILSRSGVDYGDIIDLIPIARGTSGRLWKLKIVGTKKTKIIGKELEIRRTLSTSHLYSSAFVVEKEGVEGGIPSKFRIIGAGWGHGVGLCQIGAAVMGEQGYKYDEILLHYYVGATIDKQY